MKLSCPRRFRSSLATIRLQRRRPSSVDSGTVLEATTPEWAYVQVNMRQQVIALLAVLGMILAFRPGMTSETNGWVSRHERSTRVDSDGVVAAEHSAWKDYASGPDGAEYSVLDQIKRSNVSQLRVAWSYPTGDGSK